jgi:hypothetical protein
LGIVVWPLAVIVLVSSMIAAIFALSTPPDAM